MPPAPRSWQRTAILTVWRSVRLQPPPCKIADEAEIGIATLYRYFPSKDSVLLVPFGSAANFSLPAARTVAERRRGAHPAHPLAPRPGIWTAGAALGHLGTRAGAARAGDRRAQGCRSERPLGAAHRASGRERARGRARLVRPGGADSAPTEACCLLPIDQHPRLSATQRRGTPLPSTHWRE
ncbi:TetR family transcriptional regulator [Subtercola lobariae]|uniref:TetR family transcriptional regulator n=1 Tax=Subtercola lobariae TaxID=1588641 RepID=UPI00166A85DB